VSLSISFLLSHIRRQTNPLAFLAAGLVAVALPGLAQAPTFHSDVNLVNVTFSVRDASGKLIGDLSPNDVELLEDGVPQKIKFFSRTADLPLAIGLIVDASDSQEHFFKEHHHHVEKFLKDVMGPRDRAFLVCFGNRIQLVSDLTSSVPQIMDGFERFDHGGSFPEIGPHEKREEGTALFDSIVYATQEKLTSTDQGRRALVLFSDGEDNASAHDQVDAIEVAQGADVLVYSIRYTERRKGRLSARNKYGIRIMQREAQDTGAADFDATEDTDLDQTFREIGAELRSLYEVGYHTSNPTRDGTFRKITVRVNRAGATVRSKAGYFSQQ
jgi:Ca-activated chloride channel family protein